MKYGFTVFHVIDSLNKVFTDDNKFLFNEALSKIPEAVKIEDNDKYQWLVTLLKDLNVTK